LGHRVYIDGGPKSGPLFGPLCMYTTNPLILPH